MKFTHILLPHKEIMTEQNAGAVASIVAQHARLSPSDCPIQVFGAPTNDAPLSGVNYVPLTSRFSWVKGRNIALASAYIEKLKRMPNPALLEVHGRAQVARYVCQKRPDLPVILYLHNDPREMKAAQTKEERLWLVKNLAGIICVSAYIKECFLEGLLLSNSETNAVQSVLNGSARSNKLYFPKDKSILIVGRMVPEKGILPACRAIAQVLAVFPDWTLHVVGGRHFKQAPPTKYEQLIERAISPVKEQVYLHGFQPASVIKALQSKAAISVVPSLWPEPCGLTGLEALAAGSALLTTNSGGIPEYASGHGVMIKLSGIERDDQNAEAVFQNTLAREMHRLISDNGHRENLQHKAVHNFPYTAENMVVIANKVRQDFLGRFTNTQL